MVKVLDLQLYMQMGEVPYLDANGNPYYKYEWLDNAGNVVDTNMTATNLSV